MYVDEVRVRHGDGTENGGVRNTREFRAGTLLRVRKGNSPAALRSGAIHAEIERWSDWEARFAWTTLGGEFRWSGGITGRR